MKVLLVGMVAIAVVACGDSNGPGKQAASITGVAGDSQLAPTGAAFAFPLSFTALGSDGLPIQGVNVNWTVTPTGGALFNPQSTQTDANGIASTNVRAGTDTGEIVIRANVAGVSPVVYHALVLDPCAFAASYQVPDTVTGVLATTDCNLANRGWYYDFYALATPPAQQSLSIKMKSSTFDTFVDLYNTAGELVAFDDDSLLGVVQNSQLDIIVPGDTYLIGANSFDPFTTGTYTLAATRQPAGMDGCRQVWVARGVTVSDSITNTTVDCADSSATPRHYDVARIIVYAGTSGTVLSISARSTAINPTLALYHLNLAANYARTLVASNDDSAATTTTAFIAYTVIAPNAYDILISTSAVGETGTYTLEVSPLLTFSARASKPAATGREFWRGRTLLPKR